jgi:hypothetical protein
MSSGLSEDDINKYFSVQELRQAIKQYGYDTSVLFSGYTRLTKAQLIKLIINQGMHFQLANDLGVLKGDKKVNIEVGKSRELPTRIKQGMAGEFKSKEMIQKKNEEAIKKMPKKPELDYRLTMAKGKVPISSDKRQMKKSMKSDYAKLTMVENKLNPQESAMNKVERGKFEKNLKASESKYQKQREKTSEKQQGQAMEQEMLAKAQSSVGIKEKKPTKKNYYDKS